MYYCANCGIVVYYNRPDTPEKQTKPYLEKTCYVCKADTGFRKVLPEYFAATHMTEFDRFKDQVSEILELETEEEEEEE